MNCQEVREHLSAYYDGELPADKHAAVAEHVAECLDCVQELAAFASMTAMTGDFGAAEPPEHIWSGIEKQLDERAAVPLAETGEKRPSLATATKPIALAATVLVAVGVGWFVYETVFDRDNHDQHFVAEFGEYLDEFRQDPDAAQRSLVAKYKGRLVDPPDQALSHVGYRPAVAEGLPEGYGHKSTYLLKMPCCTCVQTICERDDGTRLAIFEHDDEDHDWFAERPHISAQCNGQQCSLYELQDRLAAIWKRGARHITLVGVRDITEVSQFVAWFDNRRQAPVE